MLFRSTDYCVADRLAQTGPGWLLCGRHWPRLTTVWQTDWPRLATVWQTLAQAGYCVAGVDQSRLETDLRDVA